LLTTARSRGIGEADLLLAKVHGALSEPVR
jgi:hypothetical protein